MQSTNVDFLCDPGSRWKLKVLLAAWELLNVPIVLFGGGVFLQSVSSGPEIVQKAIAPSAPPVTHFSWSLQTARDQIFLPLCKLLNVSVQDIPFSCTRQTLTVKSSLQLTSR